MWISKKYSFSPIKINVIDYHFINATINKQK